MIFISLWQKEAQVLSDLFGLAIIETQPKTGSRRLLKERREEEGRIRPMKAFQHTKPLQLSSQISKDLASIRGTPANFLIFLIFEFGQ